MTRDLPEDPAEYAATIAPDWERILDNHRAAAAAMRAAANRQGQALRIVAADAVAAGVPKAQVARACAVTRATLDAWLAAPKLIDRLAEDQP